MKIRGAAELVKQTKLKVGQKIKVKHIDDLIEEFGVKYNNDGVNIKYGYTRYMHHELFGKELKILELKLDSASNEYICIISGGWLISDAAIKEICEDDTEDYEVKLKKEIYNFIKDMDEKELKMVIKAANEEINSINFDRAYV